MNRLTLKSGLQFKKKKKKKLEPRDFFWKYFRPSRKLWRTEHS